MKRIGIVYHEFPHYRASVISTLALSKKYKYVFACSHNSVFGSVKKAKFPDHVEIQELNCWRLGSLLMQPRIVQFSKKNDLDAIIVLGNPNFVFHWIELPFLKLKSVPILMWTHGWLSYELGIKSKLRMLYYGLADKLLLYGENAKTIGSKFGIEETKMHVIYNSLNFDYMMQVYSQITDHDVEAFRAAREYNATDTIIVCSSRLVKKCRFSDVIRALKCLNREREKYRLIIVGDGEELASLRNLAIQLNVSVEFFGECYDEKILAVIYKASNVCVYPGNIGLSAIHSLTYGTPVLTHDKREVHGPEVEIIKDGFNGAFFKHGNIESMVQVIRRWSNRTISENIELRCIESVEEKYTPINQVRQIESALDRVFPN